MVKISNETQAEISKINPQILEWLSVIDIWISRPQSSYDIDSWLLEAEGLLGEFNITANMWPEWPLVQELLNIYESQFQSSFVTSSGIQETNYNAQCSDIEQKIENCLKKTQTQQRTEAWYQEHKNLLTGSEIGDLFESVATREALIWSKVIPKEPRMNGNQAVLWEHLGPFDWGHKFEPVVKQLFEWKNHVKISELGRIHHPTEARLAASPDGIIVSAEGDETSQSQSQNLVGHLVEIKCPVSRKPDGRIVPKYYHQMQLQLAVTELDTCIFMEYTFISGYKKEFDLVQSGWTDAIERGQPHGRIYIVERAEILPTGGEWISHRYEYSPINRLDWEPDIDREKEHIVESMPWALGSAVEQKVKASPEWWAKTQTAVHEFWAEVERRRSDYACGKIAPPTPRRRTAPTDANQQQLCVIKLS